MDEAQIHAELERARATYRRRDDDPRLADIYEPLSPGPLFTVQEREWLTARLLRHSGMNSLRGLDILDVGCGSGIEMHRLALWGADPARMAGVDLMDDRIAAAKRRVPAADLHVGSAHELPFPPRVFDLVIQFTMFSSIMSAEVRSAAAAEMLRVLRTGGRILWYDIRAVPRLTPDIHPIPDREITALFQGCDILICPSTLRWGILRRTVPISRHLGLILERVAPLNSHLLAVIRPRPSDT